MQNPSSSVSSGNMSPAIVGSDRGSKEVYILGGAVLIVAVAIGEAGTTPDRISPMSRRPRLRP